LERNLAVTPGSVRNRVGDARISRRDASAGRLRHLKQSAVCRNGLSLAANVGLAQICGLTRGHLANIRLKIFEEEEMPESSSPWLTYQGTKVWRPQGLAAYTYVTSHVEIDADGAPNAYHPNDTGLDALANAGFPGGGWRDVLVQDPVGPGQPFVQKAGAFAGFFVSKTTLEDPDAPATEPRRYVDATTFPYIVFPGAFEQLEGTGVIGDIVLAKHIDAGLTSSAVVADLGPRNAALGEISIRLAANLGGTNPNPRTGAGAPRGNIRYVVFPRSHADPKWPVSLQDLDRLSAQLLNAAGGWAVFDALGP
jgi:hypothetical protein